MFGSTVLEVALGLTFIYLMLSLICSALQELIASFLKLRSTNLYSGIQMLLGSSLAATLYDHPFIKTLHGPKSLPSYIPSRLFVKALLDVVAPSVPNQVITVDYIRTQINKVPDANLQKILLILLNESGDDIEKLRGSVEQWFCEAMERVSGWYKRRTHIVIFVVAVIVTVVANADTMMIVNTLAKDTALRTTVANQAELFSRSVSPFGMKDKEQPSSGGIVQPSQEQELMNRANEIDRQLGALEQTGLQLGWRISATTEPKNPKNQQDPINLKNDQDPRRVPLGIGEWVYKIFGLIITACALSLGAPFWFDILKKVSTIRSSGRAPSESK